LTKCNFVLVQDSAAECTDGPGRRGEAKGHGNAEGRQQ
jgi:hypothetical protein